MYCATRKGEKTLSFASATDVYDYFGGVWHEGVTELKFTALTGETKYFLYGERAGLEKFIAR